MRIVNRLFVALLVTSLSGCAIPTRESVMDSWMGRHESELVSNFGEPTMAVRNREGMIILTWDERDCIKSFTVDASGEVVNWDHLCSSS